MRILILGGGSALARTVANVLQSREALAGIPISGLCLADKRDPVRVEGPIPNRGIELDLAYRDRVDAVLALGWEVILHLGETDSTIAEEDFAAGMRDNFFGTFNLFDSIRASGHMPRVIYASSIAARLAEASSDDALSFGAQKAIGERLLHDYTRRGAFHGVSARIPLTLVHPGDAPAPVADFLSAMIRDPMRGEPAMCPVPVETKICVASLQSCARNLVHLCEVETGPAPVELPALSIEVGDLLTAIEEVGGAEAAALIDIDRHEAAERMLHGLPAQTGPVNPSLTPEHDESLAAIIAAYWG